MADNTTSEWNPPVEFYFLVDFQTMNGRKFKASFLEINGLGWNFSTEQKTTDSNEKLQMPTGLSCPNLTFKRLLRPLDEDFSTWLNTCSKMIFLSGEKGGIAKNKACDVVIKLLDKNGQPLAAWSCNHAYPIKYSISGFDAGRSGLVTETIELVYNRLERVK